MVKTTPTTIVLDTNVCLDLFVFRDERWQRLYSALADGVVLAVSGNDCRAEWLAVLDYARFDLTPERKRRCMEEFDGLIKIWKTDRELNKGQPVLSTARRALPRCTDCDDQKFLELAFDTGATSLITKDKALLKLNGKCRRAGLFDVVKPETWIASFAA